MLLHVVVVFVVTWNSDLCLCDQNETLSLVVTIFRHGDRTNEIFTSYPNDPYINETYQPYGNGELTNTGKLRMYRLGQTFRIMFDSFLGPLYVTNEVKAISSSYNRAQCSLQLFLAGLFPPIDTPLEWHKHLNWNPIPYTTVTPGRNQIFSIPTLHCPKFQQLLEAYRKTPEARAVEKQFQPLYPYVSEHSGLQVFAIQDLLFLYYGFTTQTELGFKLPSWTSYVYPHYLEKVAESNYRFMTATADLNRLYGGFLLKKILKDVYKKINGFRNQPKMYVYSGHDVNVISILAALNVFHPHIPKYSAAVILEVHTIHQKTYIKVRYNPNVYDEFSDVIIPGCKSMCPIEDLVRLVEKHLPEDGDPCMEDQAIENYFNSYKLKPPSSNLY